jgi:hypothetical protein
VNPHPCPSVHFDGAERPSRCFERMVGMDI